MIFGLEKKKKKTTTNDQRAVRLLHKYADLARWYPTLGFVILAFNISGKLLLQKYEGVYC